MSHHPKQPPLLLRHHKQYPTEDENENESKKESPEEKSTTKKMNIEKVKKKKQNQTQNQRRNFYHQNYNLYQKYKKIINYHLPLYAIKFFPFGMKNSNIFANRVSHLNFYE